MGMRTVAGVFAFAVLAAGSALGASRCAKPDEMTAIHVAAIQQELMVAALTCDEVSDFNQFQTGYGPELRASDGRLEHMFQRLYGFSSGESRYHAFKTRLANKSSIRSARDNRDFCRDARQVFAAALDGDRPTLAAFVSGVRVSANSPVHSCAIN